jgi:hypothetical protein
VGESYRILVTGSREGVEMLVVWELLDETLVEAQGRGYREFTVVHGDAEGVDRHAAAFCEDQAAWYDNAGLVLAEERHRPDWGTCSMPTCTPVHRRRRKDGTTFCPAAALYRDGLMVASGATICLAWIAPCVKRTCRKPRPHGSHGATYTADLAERAGIPTRRWP